MKELEKQSSPALVWVDTSRLLALAADSLLRDFGRAVAIKVTDFTA